jgi:SAM-dependent methyltransferase
MSHGDAQDFWSDRYRAIGRDYLFGTEPNRFLSSQAALMQPGQRALSVADGEGRNAVWLAQQGLDVTATDLSPVAIEKAEALAAQRGVAVDFVLADALCWIYPEDTFDLVVAIFIQFAAPDERAQLFAKVKDTLKPGGIVVLQGYTPRQLEYRTGGPSDRDKLYTRALLAASFADFDIEVLHEYEDVLTEGSGHSGRSALIGMVARKPV